MTELLFFLAVPLLLLAVVVKLDAPPEEVEARAGYGRVMGLPWLDDLLHRLKPWHAVVAVVVTGLVFAAASGPRNEALVFLAAAVLLGLFARAWRDEFVRVMLMSEDDFLHRYDRVVWIVLLVALPPVGVSFFRAYRRSVLAEVAREAVAKPAAAGAAHDLL
jgi:hypothetical protein